MALIVLVLAVVAINPDPWAKGVAIRAVTPDSPADIAGIESPEATTTPRGRERVISINNEPIENMEDYSLALDKLKPNRTIHIKTNKGLYKVVTESEFIETDELETQTITEEFFNETLNETITIEKNVTINKKIETGAVYLGLGVYDAPTNNIRKGLELQGGTRVLLQPEEKVSSDDMSMLIDNMKYRLNVYGISDVVVREAGDLSGNQYVLVEIAGAKEEEAQRLLSQQGKFEAKVGNETVFRGGNDITYVCRSADCAGIDPMVGCGQAADGWVCRFRFSISLSPEAAQRQADATADLEVISENDNDYLSEKLGLYLDDALVDELNIGSDLKGKAATEISISGSGAGITQQDAMFNSLENMKSLQTVLITGSLPVKLNIVESDALSPLFGPEMLRNALLVGLLAILAVGIVVFIRYRKLKITIPMVITMFVEVISLLGVAALIGWNIDFAAIAGILIALGTSIDHQIVIADETLKGGNVSEIYDWKKRFKSAFFIIMAAYFTTFVAMIPLWFAGAGLLKGFALTTIIGLTIGVLITRPAYAVMIENLLK